MMCKISNRATLFAILRRDNDLGRDVVCAFTNTVEHADDLKGEYEQQWKDSGGGDESYYYVVANMFYAG